MCLVFYIMYIHTYYIFMYIARVFNPYAVAGLDVSRLKDTYVPNIGICDANNNFQPLVWSPQIVNRYRNKNVPLTRKYLSRSHHAHNIGTWVEIIICTRYLVKNFQCLIIPIIVSHKDLRVFLFLIIPNYFVVVERCVSIPL